MAHVLAFSLVVPDACAAPLSNESKQVLREAAEGRAALFRGQTSFQPAVDRGNALVKKLGAVADVDALPFLVELQDTELIHWFEQAFQGPSTPSLVNTIIQFRRDPVVGWNIVRLTRKNSSRELFDALLSDLRLPKIALPKTNPRDQSYRYDYARALLLTELPGVEADVLEVMQDPLFTRIAADFLAGRKYAPAAPVLAEMIDKTPTSSLQIGELALVAAKFKNQQVHDAVARKLVQLGRNRDNQLFERNFGPLVVALGIGHPFVKMSPLLLEEQILQVFTAAERVQIANMLRDHARKEKMTTEITAENLVYWMATDEPDDVVKWFIDRHVDVNGQTSQGFGRPLNAAVWSSQRLLLVPRLLAAGANPRLGGTSGSTPLHVISSHMQYGRPFQAELQKVMDMLIAAGADVSAADAEGRTPLHLAVSAGNLLMAEALLDRKADVNSECKDLVLRVKGVTPLQLAIDLKNEPMQALLSARGGRVSRILQARRAWNAAVGSLLGPFIGPMH